MKEKEINGKEMIEEKTFKYAVAGGNIEIIKSTWDKFHEFYDNDDEEKETLYQLARHNEYFANLLKRDWKCVLAKLNSFLYREDLPKELKPFVLKMRILWILKSNSDLINFKLLPPQNISRNKPNEDMSVTLKMLYDVLTRMGDPGNFEKNGTPLIHWLLENTSVEELECALRFFSRQDSKKNLNEKGQSALSLAIELGEVKKTKTLLKSGDRIEVDSLRELIKLCQTNTEMKNCLLELIYSYIKK